MIDYEALPSGAEGCRMQFLQHSLDDETAVPCGRCDNCAGAWYPTDIASEATAKASATLDRVGAPVEPRAQWPTGADRLGVNVKGTIPLTERASEGRALARLTDLGWGGVLRSLFAAGAPDAPASPELIAACVRVLADWGWDQRPVGVVSMPSRRHPLLIASVAHGLANAGRLPYLGELTLLGDGPRGEPGGNSAYRLASVWGAFGTEVRQADGTSTALPRGPILLVDDLVDSRWTLTVAARALRAAGADAVLPFALALRG
jgi:ATP-dependent DNA helicase RecQ